MISVKRLLYLSRIAWDYLPEGELADNLQQAIIDVTTEMEKVTECFNNMSEMLDNKTIGGEYGD